MTIFSTFLIFILIVLLFIAGIVILIVVVMRNKNTSRPESISNATASTPLSKLNAMRSRLAPWNGELERISPFNSFKFVSGFDGERKSGFIYDYNNNPVIAFIYHEQVSASLRGVVLAGDSSNAYGVNLGHGFAELYLNNARLGIYRPGHGIFDNANNCIGNLGLQHEYGNGVIRHGFTFRSGAKGELVHVIPQDPESYQPASYSGPAIQTSEGKLTGDEKHWIISLYALLAAEPAGIRNSTAYQPQDKKGTGFTLKMFFTIMFIVFGMPVVNHLLLEYLVFPGYEGSMTFTKGFFSALCFMCFVFVFSISGIGYAIFAVLFNKKALEPRNSEEEVKMEKTSRLNYVILPAGLVFGLLWGTLMGIFTKDLDIFSTAWKMALYGFGFGLMIIFLIRSGFISMFALSEEVNETSF